MASLHSTPTFWWMDPLHSLPFAAFFGFHSIFSSQKNYIAFRNWSIETLRVWTAATGFEFYISQSLNLEISYRSPVHWLNFIFSQRIFSSVFCPVYLLMPYIHRLYTHWRFGGLTAIVAVAVTRHCLVYPENNFIQRAPENISRSFLSPSRFFCLFAN